MRLVCCLAAVVVLSPLTARAPAQQPLHVVRHVPFDSVRVGEPILVTFDRPVAPSVERAPDPARFVRIDPALPGAIQWRDPTTIRIVPNERARVGPHTITVDRFAAADGGRLAAPYVFTVRSLGPRFLGRVPRLTTEDGELFDPSGIVTLVYTTPVDTADLSRVARLEIAADRGCVRQTIHYRVQSTRPISSAENAAVVASISERDDPDRAIRTSVQLQADGPIPEGCIGSWVIPSFDAADRPEVRYRMVTMPAFQIVGLACTDRDCAAARGLALVLSAPVQAEVLARSVLVEPRAPFTIERDAFTGKRWVIRTPVKLRTTYRVSLDSTLRDIYGRSLSGAHDITLAVGDRPSAIGHQLGFFTVSRAHPVIRIAHLNVDTVDIVMIPIPDSLRAAVVAASPSSDSVARIVGRLADTLHQLTTLPRKPNAEQMTEVMIPGPVLDRDRGGLIAIRARARPRPPVWSDVEPHTPGELPAIQILGRLETPSPYVALVQVTDLLAHAKVDAAWGSVFVTDINGGQPVAGATVTLKDSRGQVAATGVTTASGVADLHRSPDWRAPRTPTNGEPMWDPYWGAYGGGQRRLVEVARGGDRSMTLVGNYSPELQVLEVGSPDASYDRDRLYRAMVFTERPIYRPGEQVYLAAIAREGRLGELTVPRGDSVRIRVSVSDYDGPDESEVVRDTVVRLGSVGSVADSFTVSPRARLGSYSVRMEAVVDSSWRPVAWTGFRVAEYRAPEFRATVVLDTGVRFLGDTIRGTVSSRYYFGAAMAGAEVNWNASVSALRVPLRIPGLPGDFVIGRGYYEGPDREPAGEERSGVDTLDAKGSVAITVPTKVGTLNRPGELTVSVSVQDLNRTTVTATATTPVHPSAFYVAVRDPGRDWYWKQDVARPFDVFAIRPDGKRVAGARVSIVALRHHYVWSQQADGSYSAPIWVTDTVARDSVVTTDSIVKYRYTPTEGGSHQLLFTVRDDGDRPLTTTIGRYVVATRGGSWEERPASLSMRLTPDTAAIGDTVRVHFMSPFPRAEAWVTVEREGMLAQQRLTVRQGEVAVPLVVASQFLPGAVVAVTLVDATAAWQTDSLHERIRVARAALHVGRSPKQPRVEIIAAKDRYQPADTARITVRLRDQQMQPVRGDVTLWAVDESVMALEDYEQPDPYAAMYADRQSGLTFATTAANLARLHPALTPPGWYLHALYGRMAMNSAVALSTATAAPGVNVPLRSSFRTTAFFLHALRTDATGSVTATVKLPDNLTTYRVLAVAATEDSRFGAAETSLLITKPLLARAALPRFVRPGDAILAGAVLTNQTGARQSVSVRASGRAAALEGASTVTRTLGADSSAEVRFGWRTSASPGDTAAFRFDVNGGGYGDAVLTSLPVRPHYTPRFHTVTGVARGTTDVRMVLPKELDPARSRLTLQVGTTPVSVIRNNYWRLHVYPYYCSEQLTSAGLSIAAVMRLQRAGIMDSTVAPRLADLRRELQAAVDEVSRRITEEGGIGYWAPDSWTDARLTTYVGSFLLTARELGAEVRPHVLSNIASYLADVSIPEPDTTYGDRRARARAVSGHLAARLARLEYLQRIGAPDTVAENELAEHESAMLWEDRILLARVLGAREDKAPARAVLARAWQRVGLGGNRLDVPDSLIPDAWFPSRVRPIARLVRTTMALDPSNPRLGAAIETVVSQQRAVRGWWWIWNTHDYAAASSALADIATWQRTADTSGAVAVRSLARRHRDRLVMTGERGVQSDSATSLAGLVERDGEWLVLPLRIDAGDRAVYYSLTVEEVPTSAPTRPDAKGVIVERWFERFDNGRPATEVKEGELVRGRLRITLPSDREFLAVEDLLPAGLEVVDLSLRTSSTLAPFENEATRAAKAAGDAANPSRSPYGTWYDGWWSPWEHQEIRDDRVVYFARLLEKGTYTATYVARATTAGTFIRPPAHAEEMYNPSLGGRSEGGVFRVNPK